ncbi:MAG: DUF4983 domain-containing protein [Flavobacteriales bacterium]|jgi:hypothetical protein|nr:DUF4983 domain-containing protein [Flavobacteriales bacterium]MBT6013541.1 DUF4983 domain-containing protein [Flavobacteriales bacterium]MBT7481279.1 DUF4983 domain-containing protein [Flavobacteriales bacterium]
MKRIFTILFLIPLIGISQDYQLDFNSATLDYVEIPNASFVIANKTEFTISGWVNPQMDASHSGFFGFRNNSDADFFLLQLQNSTNVEARFRNSAGVNFDVVANSILDIGLWQHLAFTYDGSYIKLYKNGSMVDSSAANGTITNISQSFKIGSLDYQSSSFPMQGSTDEVRLWDAALSESTINSWMCDPVDLTHPNYNNLMGYWRLNDGSGTSVTDNSPNQLLGTLINSTWNLSTSCFSNSIFGCTDVNACNYNSLANIDDGSCYFTTAQINQNGFNLDAIVNSGISPYSYIWSTGEYTNSISPQTNALYWLIVTDSNMCLSDTAYFDVTFISTSLDLLNSDRKLIKSFNLAGQNTSDNKQGVLFQLFNDGTVEKKLIIN